MVVLVLGYALFKSPSSAKLFWHQMTFTANYLLDTFGVKARKPSVMEAFQLPSFNREDSTISHASTIAENESDIEWIRNGVLFPKLFWPTVRKKCSSYREKLLKFKAESQECTKFLRSLEQFIQTVKGQNTFWQQNAFLTCSWRFLRSNKLEQLEFKSEKNIEI